MKNNWFVNRSLIEKVLWLWFIVWILTMTWVISVFGEFWRANVPNPFTAIEFSWEDEEFKYGYGYEDEEFKYGYGYGSQGWGYGYGYGYGLVELDNNARYAGYYVWWDYTVSDASDLVSVSKVQWVSDTEASKITMTNNTTISSQVDNRISVFLRDRTEITSVDSDWNEINFNPSALAVSGVDSINDINTDGENKGAVNFGMSGHTLHFSKAVKIDIPVDNVDDGVDINVQRNEGGNYNNSLATNETDCTAWEPDNNKWNEVTVDNEKATIYTCSASDFVAYVPEDDDDTTNGSRWWGGWGWTPICGEHQMVCEKHMWDYIWQRVDGVRCRHSQLGQFCDPEDVDEEDEHIDEEDTTPEEITTIKEEASKQDVQLNLENVQLRVPEFDSEQVQATVESLNQQIIAELEKRRVSGPDLEKFIQNYNEFLAAVKIIQDKQPSEEIYDSARRNIQTIVSTLNDYKSITPSSELVDEEFENALSFLKRYGLTRYSNVDEFRPFDNLQRQEAASFFAGFGREVIWLTSNWNNCNFTDLEWADHTLTPQIQSACQMWIMWTQITEFRPFDNISRAETFTVLVRSITGETLDETVDPWWDQYFEVAQALGLTKEDNTWNQDRDITRYEAALIIYRSWLNL